MRSISGATLKDYKELANILKEIKGLIKKVSVLLAFLEKLQIRSFEIDEIYEKHRRITR